MNKLLYGYGTTERIVAAEPVYGKENFVRRYIRNEDDEIEQDFVEISYYLHTKADDPALSDTYSDINKIPALGTLHYDTIVETKHFPTFKWLEKNANHAYSAPKQSQYFIQTGDTLFKGMTFDGPLRLYVDIEVHTAKGFEFPNSSRREDEIIIIALCDNRGREWTLVNKGDEVQLLNDFLKLFREIDPDIIVNHNQFRFDLPYLQDRFNLHNIEFALGRNGTEPYTYPTNIKFGGRTMEYTNFSIEGRHVIDTYFLVKQADVFKRDMPGHGLKDVVKYLGKASDDRVYIPGDRIASVWRGEDPEFTREQLIHYALDDVREARILDLAYGQSVFYSTQYVPLPLQDVARYGTGTMIELLFYREYLRNRYSWPKPNPERDFGGGFFHLYEYGIINEPLVYVDVSSLYPYLGDSLNTKPANDELDVYRRLLGGMKAERLADKATANRLKAEGKLEEAEPIDNKQNSTKIYINTGYYGYLTWSMASLNDYDNGEKITSTGQASLKKMIEIIDEMGGRTIRAATDGLLVVPPPEYQGSIEKENEMIAVVQDKLNAWFGPTYNVDTDKNPMILDHDGRYEGMISFDTLSCVLRKPGGKYSIKGNTLKNRALEQFGREFLMKSFDYLFDKDYEGLKKMYEEYLVLTENGMLSAEAVSKTSSINKTLKEYQDSVDSGKSNRAAAYELALASSRKYEKGDSITYYVKDMGYEEVEVRGKIKRRKVKAKAFESAEPIENYNYDYDVDYYVKRLETALRKLLPVLGVERHKELFPKVKLYKKDLDKLADHE